MVDSMLTTLGRKILMKRVLKKFSLSAFIILLAFFATGSLQSPSSARSVRIVSVTGTDAPWVSYSRSGNVWRYSACFHTDQQRLAYLQVKINGRWNSYRNDGIKSYTYDPINCSKHYPYLLEYKVHEYYPGDFKYRIGYPDEYDGYARFYYFTVSVR